MSFSRKRKRNGDQRGRPSKQARVDVPLMIALGTLPPEIIVNIAIFLNLSEIIHVSEASHFFLKTLFRERHHALDNLRQLLSSSALAEWNQARAIWTRFPELLTHRGTIYHPNPPAITPEMNLGRYQYTGTAWQIALRNEEFEIAFEMAQLMSEGEKEKQFFEIFPDGVVMKHDWDLTIAKELLFSVFEKMTEDKNRHVIFDALSNLYAYLRRSATSQTGLVFDIHFYFEALDLLEKLSTSKVALHFDSLNTMMGFWHTRIIEPIAYQLGTGYLRAHTQGFLRGGLGGLLEFVPNQSDCLLANGEPYFAFRRPLHAIPGVHFFVNAMGQPSQDPILEKLLTVFKSRKTFMEELHAEKCQQLLRLQKPTHSKSSSFCIIL
jgi:hypothetical protein